MIDTIYSDPNFLAHHGVKGMKWGVRRYQNTDGSLTQLGKKRSAKAIEKEFKSGKDRNATKEIAEKAISKERINELKSVNDQISKLGYLPDSVQDDYESKEYKDLYSEAIDTINNNFEEYIGRSRKEEQADLDAYNKKHGTKLKLEDTKKF